MLYAFAFDGFGVVISDLYFVNPDPEPGQEGPEQGVRLEIRLFERGELPGSIYSAQPIAVGRPVWRADLLESVAHPGTLDRAHHHPRFRGWEPGPRTFDPDMSSDPVAYVGRRLENLEGLLTEAGVEVDQLSPPEAGDVRAAVPEMLAAVSRLLDQVRSERPRVASGHPEATGVRVGWL